jgi:hypothetical protein
MTRWLELPRRTIENIDIEARLANLEAKLASPQQWEGRARVRARPEPHENYPSHHLREGQSVGL